VAQGKSLRHVVDERTLRRWFEMQHRVSISYDTHSITASMAQLGSHPGSTKVDMATKPARFAFHAEREPASA